MGPAPARARSVAVRRAPAPGAAPAAGTGRVRTRTVAVVDGFLGARGPSRRAQCPSGEARPRQTGTFAVGPGYPWPLVALGAVVVTGLLAWLLMNRAGLLGLMFPIGYLVVCMLGVAMVRAEAVAVPALAPPVVAFLGLVIAAIVAGNAASSTLFLLGVFAPLAELFWWMLVATVACLVVGFLRFRQIRPGWSPLAALRGTGAA